VLHADEQVHRAPRAPSHRVSSPRQLASKLFSRAWLPTAPARVAGLLFAVAWGANHFVPLLPLYRAALALSTANLGSVFGIYALGLVPGLLAGGPISDRIGRRTLVLPAAAVALIGTGLLAAGSGSLSGLLVGRFVVGLGSGGTFSAATAWVQELAAPDPVPGTGARRAAAALSAGFGGGPLVASVLAQWLPHPFLLPYLIQAAVLIVAIAGLALLPPSHRAVRRAESASVPSHASFLPRGFLAEVVPVAPWVFGFPSIAFAVLPALVRGRLGALSVLYTGAVTAITLLAGLAVQSPLRARSARRAGRIGLATGVLGLLLATLAARALSPGGVVIAAICLGAGYGGCLVSGLRFVEAHSQPSERGRITGIFYVLAYLGFAAPVLLAALARRHRDTTALLCAAALAVASLVLQGWKSRVKESA
jgi:predicted MFS family arabinose efflux permease